MISKSSIMTAYNRAIACGKFDTARVNRALGIALRSTTKILSDGRMESTNPKTGDWQVYDFSACTCIDKQKRGGKCKHNISYAILKRAYEYETVSEVK